MKEIEELRKMLILDSSLENNERLGTDSVQQRFEQIAKKLINNFRIKKGNDIYDFLEIEFYYYNKEHKDYICYPRNAEAGDWFFHKSGVDITFKSKTAFDTKRKRTAVQENDFFGGILIRGIMKNNESIIAGPINVENELFDKFSAVNNCFEEFPILVSKASEGDMMDELSPCIRRIPMFQTQKDEDRIEKRWNTFKQMFGENVQGKSEDYKVGLATDNYCFFRKDIDVKLNKFNLLKEIMGYKIVNYSFQPAKRGKKQDVLNII